MTYSIGEFVVCPGHGVGQVCDLDEREIGGAKRTFYIIKVLANGLKVMIPEDSKDGIRKLVDGKEVNKVFNLLRTHDVEIDNSTWNRRHREYMQKINTGSLLEIADVLRSLSLLKNTKTLSFGEKKMLDQCKSLLVREIALAKESDENVVTSEIDACFNS